MSETALDTRDQTEAVAAGWRVVSGCTLLSRVLGMARDVGMAALFGNGAVMDAFTVAFRLPNLARRMFGEGALTAAFLPVFVTEQERAGSASANRLALGVLMSVGLVLSGLVLSGEVICGSLWLFGDLSPETSLLVRLTALLLPYLVLICLSSQLCAVLHGLNNFFWPAIVPIVLNVVWIAGVFAAGWMGDVPEVQIVAISAAILLAGVLQVWTPWQALRRQGFGWDSHWRESLPRVWSVWRSVVPILFGLAVIQINPLVDSLIAWSFSPPESATAAEAANYPLTTGTASALYYGQRLFQFPLGLIGVALGTVLFPVFSRCASRGDLATLREHLTTGLRLVICITVPASVGLVLLAEPLTDLLFRRGEFDAGDVRQTAAMVAVYGVTVWAACGLLVVNRAFYAMNDRRGPLRLGMFCVLFNVLLDFVLVWPLGGSGLAAATSIATAVQCVVAVWSVQSLTGSLAWRPFLKSLAKTVLASAVMVGVLFAMNPFLPTGSEGTARLLRVMLPVGAAVATYLLAARVLRMEEPRLLLGRAGKSV